MSSTVTSANPRCSKSRRPTASVSESTISERFTYSWRASEWVSNILLRRWWYRPRDYASSRKARPQRRSAGDLIFLTRGSLTIDAAPRPAQIPYPVGSGTKGWTETQHVAEEGRPAVDLHSDDGGELTRNLTTWYSVGPYRLSGP